MTTREKLGSIWVDTANLLIGDPCQLLASEDSPVPTYDDLMKLKFPATVEGYEELLASIERGEKPVIPLAKIAPNPVLLSNRHGGVGAICYSTGCDGYYPVFVEYEDDKAKRLVIELGGQVEP